MQHWGTQLGCRIMGGVDHPIHPATGVRITVLLKSYAGSKLCTVRRVVPGTHVRNTLTPHRLCGRPGSPRSAAPPRCSRAAARSSRSSRAACSCGAWGVAVQWASPADAQSMPGSLLLLPACLLGYKPVCAHSMRRHRSTCRCRRSTACGGVPCPGCRGQLKRADEAVLHAAPVPAQAPTTCRCCVVSQCCMQPQS